MGRYSEATLSHGVCDAGSEGGERDRAEWPGPARGAGARVSGGGPRLGPGGGLSAHTAPWRGCRAVCRAPVLSPGLPRPQSSLPAGGQVQAVLSFRPRAGPVGSGVGTLGPHGSSLPIPSPGPCPAVLPVFLPDSTLWASGSRGLHFARTACPRLWRSLWADGQHVCSALIRHWARTHRPLCAPSGSGTPWATAGQRQDGSRLWTGLHCCCPGLSERRPWGRVSLGGDAVMRFEGTKGPWGQVE